MATIGYIKIVDIYCDLSGQIRGNEETIQHTMHVVNRFSYHDCL